MNTEAILEYYAEHKLAFSSFSKKDARDLLKVMILQDIDANWESGFVHLSKLELLTKAFPEDGLLIEIYRQLNRRCAEYIAEIDKFGFSSPAEHCFRDQPCTYNENGGSPTYHYDVHKDPILEKLINKHPTLSKTIKAVVYS